MLKSLADAIAERGRFNMLLAAAGSLYAYCDDFGERFVYQGDTPCNPDPMSRMVDDFINLRRDWRWEIHWDVMDLVLAGVDDVVG